MSADCIPTVSGLEVSESLLEVRELPLVQEVPRHLEVLPDGREAIIIGDPEGSKAFNHKRGDNPYGFALTSGLVACENVLRQFGIAVTEAELVEYAAFHGLCYVEGDPALSGATKVDPAHSFESGCGVGMIINMEEVSGGLAINETHSMVVIGGIVRDAAGGGLPAFMSSAWMRSNPVFLSMLKRCNGPGLIEAAAR